MTDKQLYYFLEICKYRSLNAASGDLYISQQALSKTVKSLERELGAPLFERNVHGLKLTEIGEEFYRTVTKFLEDCDSLKEKIAFKIQNETIMNQLSLLTNSGFGCFAFPYMLRELRHKFPDIRVYKREDSSASIQRAIFDEDCNAIPKIAIISLPYFEMEKNISLFAEKNLVCLPLVESELIAAVSQKNEIAKYGKISLGDTAGLPTFMYSKNGTINCTTSEILKTYGMQNYVYVSDNASDLLSCVEEDMGIHYVHSYVDMIKARHLFPQVTFVKLQESVRVALCLVYCEKELAQDKVQFISNYIRHTFAHTI